MSSQENLSVDRYSLIRRLGSGAFGTVYLARDTFLEEEVAVKMPIRQHPDLAASLQEPRILNKVRSPHIVGLRDIEQIQGVICLVMEYVSGGSLRSRMGSFGRGNSLPASFGVDFSRGVLSALSAAHSVGVLHRDIKPDNVLITEEGLPKVTDFGISRLVEATGGIDKTMQPIGTIVYMSPEAFRGEITLESDLWATTAMLYEMLTGKLPFPGPSTGDVVNQVMSGNIMPIRQANPEIDSSLAEVIHRALHADRSKRFKSADELSGALERFSSSPSSPSRVELPPSVAPPHVTSEAMTVRLFDDIVARAPVEDWPGVLNRIHRALGDHPGDPGLHRALGDLYRKMGDDASAYDEYEKAFVIDHTDSRAALGLADLGLRLRRPERTVEALLALVDCEPQNPSFRRRLAMALEQKGDRGQAISHMKIALNLDPDQARMRRILKRWESAPHSGRRR